MRKGFARLAVLASVTAATYPLAAVADRQAPASAAGIRLYVLRLTEPRKNLAWWQAQ